MEKLTEIIEIYTEFDKIKGSSRFKEDLGLSSFDIMCIITDIEVYIGVKLIPSKFKEYNTVAELAEFIEKLK